MPQFTIASVLVMTWLRAGIVSCHLEAAPQLPFMPVPPAHGLVVDVVGHRQRPVHDQHDVGRDRLRALGLDAAVRIQRDISALGRPGVEDEDGPRSAPAALRHRPFRRRRFRRRPFRPSADTSRAPSVDAGARLDAGA